MNDNILDDVVAPVERKSIKNIPLPTRKRVRTKKVSEEITGSDEKIDTVDEIIDLRKITPKEEHVDNIKINNPYEDFNKIDSNDDFKISHQNQVPFHYNKEVYEEESDFESNRFNYKDYNKKPKNNKKIGVFKFGVIVVIVLALVATFMSIFKSASLTVFSKTQAIQNSEIILEIENSASSNNPQVLDYKEINLESVAEIKTESDSEEQVSEKASGIITVFNEYAKEPQKLITSTRFETTDGKIYRIQESLTVPGYTESNGKITPGSVDVKVVADEAGDKYNINGAEFKIPGFKDQPQYDKFYAKSKTEISGGFVGVKKIIDPENLEIAKSELETRLKNNLKELAKVQISDDFILIENDSIYTFSSPEQKGSSGNEVTLSMKGFAKYLVINKKELSKNLALKNLGTEEDVVITNFEEIQVNLIENEDGLRSLSVKGNINLKWVIDENALKNDLSGKSKKVISEIVIKHPGIQNVENVTIRPYWSSKFPADIEDIKIIMMQ